MKLTDRMLAQLDIDARQWRALVGLSWKMQKRMSSAIKMKKDSSANKLWLVLFIYGLMGLMFLPMIVLPARTAGIASFFILNVMLTFIALMILLEFGSSIVCPEDIAVLSPRPVSSRTYFASRMTMVVIVILIYAAALGGPSAFVFCFRFGMITALSLAFTIVIAGLTTGMLVILIYTTALKYISPSRIKNIIGYIQLSLTFVVYGGYGIFMEKMRGVVAATSPDSLLLIIPTSWFASMVNIASGDWTIADVAGSLLSVLVFAALCYLIVGRISLTYSEDVIEAAIAPTSRAQAARPWRRPAFHLFRRAEDRAIAMLIIRQFRHDFKFRMSVLGILPLTFFYIYYGMQGESGLADPFSMNVSLAQMGSSILLYLAIIIFPVILKGEIIHNDMYEASWIFFASPVDRGRVMTSVRRVLIRAFVLPYLLIISAVFLWSFRNPLHVVMHMVIVFLVSDMFLLVLFFFKPALPFSMPREVGSMSATLFTSMIFGPLLVMVLMGIFIEFLYPALWSYLVGVAALLIVSFVLRYLLERRLKKEGEQLEFLG